MKEYKKILCISFTGMGNSILYIPVLKTLRKSFPNAQIDVIVRNKPAKTLLENLNIVDNVMFLDKIKTSPAAFVKLWFHLWNEKYDLFVTSFLDKSLKIALFGVLSGIKDRVGFANGWWQRFYKFKAPINEKKHEVEYNLDLLRAIGINDTDNSISFTIDRKNEKLNKDKLEPVVPKKTVIGFHPGSGTDLGESVKRWGVEKFSQLADMLAEKYNAEIDIFGGKEEQELANTMVSGMKAVPKILVGTGILETAANMKRCSLFISNDSGLMHLAAALSIPVAGIFGPTLYWKNYPWQVSHVVVRSGLSCAPCYRLSGISCRNPRCLKGIFVDLVFNQISALFQDDLRAIGAAAVPINLQVVSPVLDQEQLPLATYEKTIKKISVITPDFSHNCVGRSYMIAELLKSQVQVEIIGPAFSGTIWEPIQKASKDINYTVVPCTKMQYFFSSAFKLSSLINSDVVIVSKPVLPSMFLALIVFFRKKLPTIIDIDDWEIGFELDRFIQGNFINSLKSTVQMFKLIVCELLARLVRNKIVSNTYLQSKYGGIIIPHARDTNYFDPALYKKESLRKMFSLKKEDKVILFMGTPREHKGIFELVKAYKKLNDKSVVIMLVGFNLVEESQKKLYDYVKENLGERCVLLEQQPFDKIPEFLSMADIVVIPQKDTNSSKGQIPAKLFDAMAMGKPIIGSKINDIPEILEDCGWTYEPGNIDELISIIKTVINNPAQAAKMGEKAREKCIRKYSYDAVRRRLSDIIVQTVE